MKYLKIENEIMLNFERVKLKLIDLNECQLLNQVIL